MYCTIHCLVSKLITVYARVTPPKKKPGTFHSPNCAFIFAPYTNVKRVRAQLHHEIGLACARSGIHNFRATVAPVPPAAATANERECTCVCTVCSVHKTQVHLHEHKHTHKPCRNCVPLLYAHITYVPVCEPRRRELTSLPMDCVCMCVCVGLHTSGRFVAINIILSLSFNVKSVWVFIQFSFVSTLFYWWLPVSTIVLPTWICFQLPRKRVIMLCLV